ncbi:hypothetical protein HDU87_003790 [Geranomyces variabilis]|uniref:Ankyrin repeat protein n=1 Tax=Geranomyces variabilis TaxID=109894 RepID=A0AAD5TIY3_9FUNG|nr:hypothetical protein HDU87_003790 [Geranomyces variabilis]
MTVSRPAAVLPMEVFDLIAAHADFATLVNLRCSCSALAAAVSGPSFAAALVRKWSTQKNSLGRPIGFAAVLPTFPPARFVDLTRAWTNAKKGFSYDNYFLPRILDYCNKHRALDGLEYLFSVAPDRLREWFAGNKETYREFAYSGWVDGLKFVAERMKVSPCRDPTDEEFEYSQQWETRMCHDDQRDCCELEYARTPWQAALLASQFEAFHYLERHCIENCGPAKCSVTNADPIWPALINDWRWSLTQDFFDVERWETDTFRILAYCEKHILSSTLLEQDRLESLVELASRSGSVKLVRHLIEQGAESSSDWLCLYFSLAVESLEVPENPRSNVYQKDPEQWSNLVFGILVYLVQMANENDEDECSEELDDLYMRAFTIGFERRVWELLRLLQPYAAQFLPSRLDADLVAAFRGELPIVRFLHEECEVDLLPHLDKIAFSAVHNGANAVETIPYLHEVLGFDLSSSCTVDSYSNRDNWLLFALAQKGNAACLAYLRDRGVDMRMQEDEALVRAARSSSGLPALKWLHEEEGADLCARNGAPLLAAKRDGDSPVLENVQYIMERLRT